MSQGESAEVARVRELLASRFGAARAADAAPREDVGGRDGERPAARTAAAARAAGPGATAPGGPGPGVTARIREPEARGSRRPPAVEWGPAPGSGPGPSGAREVPRAVARMFGKGERRYPSLAALDEALEGLCQSAAFGRVQDLLKARERSAAQLRQRLESEGFAPGQAAEAVERAERCGLVSDERFSEAFVASKARAGWGRERIERELARQGGEPPRGGAAERLLSPESERERAWAAVSRRPVPAARPVEKLARFLVGRGFSAEVALGAARRRVDEAGVDGEVVDET